MFDILKLGSYPVLQEPTFVPITAGQNTVDPLEFLITNVAPASVPGPMR
jgi:hypothetical protein